MAGYDRRHEDVGNIVQLEHVNVTVPDQGLAALFYVTGLGFTRDPYIDFGNRNMWINLGQQQFHLPLADAQVFRGHVDVAMPDLDGLQQRLERIAKPLAGTRFAFERRDDAVHVTCPWGNDIRAHGPDAFPRMALGMPRVTVRVAPGTTDGIARFYRDIIGCPAAVVAAGVDVRVGHNQTLRFEETGDELAAYDGHHIAVYVVDFSGPHGRLLERGLITEESDAVQYRFQAIVDPDSGALLAELEHEVRALGHPMYRRPLVNRNPAVGFMNYRQGQEIFTPP
jgi:catechol-2,3-dioxygenase